jgi:hypothetical protein
MHKTTSDLLKEEGELRAYRKTLLRQLRLRFGAVPQAVESIIESAEDAEQLQDWLGRFATARTLKDVGIALGS